MIVIETDLTPGDFILIHQIILQRPEELYGFVIDGSIRDGLLKYFLEEVVEVFPLKAKFFIFNSGSNPYPTPILPLEEWGIQPEKVAGVAGSAEEYKKFYGLGGGECFILRDSILYPQIHPSGSWTAYCRAELMESTLLKFNRCFPLPPIQTFHLDPSLPLTTLLSFVRLITRNWNWKEAVQRLALEEEDWSAEEEEEVGVEERVDKLINSLDYISLIAQF